MLKNFWLNKIPDYLLFIFLFLLPWQTRYIWHYGELNNGYWEYGTFSIYATEILLWVILLLFFVQHFFTTAMRRGLASAAKEFWMKLKEKKSRTYLVLILFLLSLFFSTALSKNFWISYNYVFKLLEAMALAVVLSGVISPLPRGSEEGVAVDCDANDEVKSNGTPPLPLLGKEGMTSGRNDRLMVALWAGAVVQGGLAISQFLTQQVWASKWLGMAGQEAGNLGPSVIEFADQRWLRAYGSFGSPNSLGIYLAVLFVLGLVLYIKAQSWRNKTIISAGQLLILSGLLVSFSRAAWIAAVAGVLSLLWVVISPLPRGSEEGVAEVLTHPQATATTPTPSWKGGDDTRTTLKDFAKQISFALVLIIFWLAIFYPVFTARFNLNNRLEVNSISERKGQYTEALSFIKANPIFGVGPGAYTYALYKKYPTLPAWQYQPIHNIYLLALVEVGLAGVIFLFFLFKHLFWQIIKNNLLYTPVVVALIFSGIFDHWLASMYTGVIFLWVIVGLGFVDRDRQMD